jgi:hypothetical protein
MSEKQKLLVYPTLVPLTTDFVVEVQEAGFLDPGGVDGCHKDFCLEQEGDRPGYYLLVMDSELGEAKDIEVWYSI